MTNEQMRVLMERALRIPIDESDAAWVLAGVEEQLRRVDRPVYSSYLAFIAAVLVGAVAGLI